MITVYGLIRDCGDGSSCLDWFKDVDLMERVMEDDPEAFYGNEGSPACTLCFKDEEAFNLSGIKLDDENFL
jgi:hypothetical protein